MKTGVIQGLTRINKIVPKKKKKKNRSIVEQLPFFTFVHFLAGSNCYYIIVHHPAKQ